MGHRETARRGLGALWRFIGDARRGADLGRKSLAAPPERFPVPIETEYWIAQRSRPLAGLAGSHLVKYPWSFYALLREVSDEGLRQRALRQLYHLTAVS